MATIDDVYSLLGDGLNALEGDIFSGRDFRSDDNPVTLGEAPSATFAYKRGGGYPNNIELLGGQGFAVRARLPGTAVFVDVTDDLTPGVQATATATTSANSLTWTWINAFAWANGWRIIIVGDSGGGVTCDPLTGDLDFAAKTVTIHYESGVSTFDDLAASPIYLLFFVVYQTDQTGTGGNILTSPADDATATFAGGADGSIVPTESYLDWLSIFDDPGNYHAISYKLTGAATHAAAAGQGVYQIDCVPLTSTVAEIHYRVGDDVQLTDLAAVYVALADAIAANSNSSLPVGHVVGGSATTTVIQTDLTLADVDGAKDGLMLFTTGALAGQPPKRIGASTDGANVEITLKSGYAFTEAPSDGDSFVIINR